MASDTGILREQLAAFARFFKHYSELPMDVIIDKFTSEFVEDNSFSVTTSTSVEGGEQSWTQSPTVMIPIP